MIANQAPVGTQSLCPDINGMVDGVEPWMQCTVTGHKVLSIDLVNIKLPTYPEKSFKGGPCEYES